MVKILILEKVLKKLNKLIKIRIIDSFNIVKMREKVFFIDF